MTAAHAADRQRRERGSVARRNQRGDTVTSDVPIVAERAMYWPMDAGDVERSAQQLRRDRDGVALGPGRGAGRRPVGVSDVRPGREPGQDPGEPDADLHADDWRHLYQDRDGAARRPLHHYHGSGLAGSRADNEIFGTVVASRTSLSSWNGRCTPNANNVFWAAGSAAYRHPAAVEPTPFRPPVTPVRAGSRLSRLRFEPGDGMPNVLRVLPLRATARVLAAMLALVAAGAGSPAEAQDRLRDHDRAHRPSPSTRACRTWRSRTARSTSRSSSLGRASSPSTLRPATGQVYIAGQHEPRVRPRPGGRQRGADHRGAVHAGAVRHGVRDGVRPGDRHHPGDQQHRPEPPCPSGHRGGDRRRHTAESRRRASPAAYSNNHAGATTTTPTASTPRRTSSC